MDELKKGVLLIDDTAYETNFTKKYSTQKKFKPKNLKEIRAFIPGLIQLIFVNVGDKVNKGDKLLILEAMKMKNQIFSPIDGKVKAINVQIGIKVPKNELLIELE